MHRSVKWFLLASAFCLGASVSGAQTAVDSTHAREIQRRTARIAAYEDSLFIETCRGGTLSASMATCSRAKQNLRLTAVRHYTATIRTLRREVDSLERRVIPPPVVTPPAPANAKPKAAFTIEWSGNTATFDATSSSDDKGITAYSWAAPGTNRPPRATATHTRVFEGEAWLEVLVVTDAGGLTDTVSRQVLGPPTPVPPPVDTTPAPTPVPPVDTTTPPPVDTTPPTPIPGPGPTPVLRVELPRAVPVSRDPYPGRACTTVLSPPANVNAALASARGGQVVCLANVDWGQTLLTLPPRVLGDTGWIVLRAQTLPTAEGTRVMRSQVPAMPRIRLTTQLLKAIKSAPGTHHWYLAGIAIHVAAPSYVAIEFGDLGAAQSTMAQVPHHMILSRMVVTADSVMLRRCVTVHTGAAAIVDSWLDECREAGNDAQAIFGANGPGPILVENNYLAGSGENIMFGGADPSIPGLVPSDITIRRNHINKPASWNNGVWQNKNSIETKNALRVLIEGNVIEGGWARHGQDNAVVFKSANQNGGCRWCRTTDVTFRLNHVSRNTSGVNITGWGDNQLNDSLTKRIAITDNVIEAGSEGGNRRGIMFGGRTRSSEVYVERNLVTGNLLSALWAEGGAPCSVRDNVFTRGQYGVIASGTTSGTPTLDRYCAPWVWSRNTMIGPTSTSYPAGTTFLAAESQSALAAQIRARVDSATRGVVVPP